MTKIKLLYVITALNVGGAEMNLYRLIRSIDHNRFDLLVVSLINKGPIGKMIENDLNVQVIALDINSYLHVLSGFIKFMRLVRSWKPHILHSHMVHANFLSRWARLIWHYPVLICTIHNIEEQGRRKSAKWRLLTYRYSDFLCDLTTQVSMAGLKKYIKIKAVPASKIIHIPNGIDLDQFKHDKAQVYKLSQSLNPCNRFIFLAVGSLTDQKDYPNLLKAFAVLLEKHSDSLLLIAGDGPLNSSLRLLAEELGLVDSVRFLGLRNDVPDLMAMADVFVISSAWEGLPVVLLEAAASSLPIIATDVGGNSEVVIDNYNGYLVAPGKVNELAEKMLEFIELPLQRQIEMGEKGYNHVKDNYSIENIIHRWEQIYNSFTVDFKTDHL